MPSAHSPDTETHHERGIRPADTISVEEARARILEVFEVLSGVGVGLTDAPAGGARRPVEDAEGGAPSTGSRYWGMVGASPVSCWSPCGARRHRTVMRGDGHRYSSGS